MMSPLAVQEKFDLEKIPITIGGHHLELFGVRNWDAFVERLEKRGAAYLSEFPFWIKFWEASFILADDLLRRDLGERPEILEIGAGMGVAGLFLAAAGHRVTITDYEEDVLDLLRLNVRENGLDNVRIEKLDWLRPEMTGTFDLICGSEVVYQERFFEPMVSLFDNYLNPGGRICLAHNMQRSCIVKFIGTLPGRYHLENRIKTLRGEDQVHRIVLHMIEWNR